MERPSQLLGDEAPDGLGELREGLCGAGDA